MVVECGFDSGQILSSFLSLNQMAVAGLDIRIFSLKFLLNQDTKYFNKMYIMHLVQLELYFKYRITTDILVE